MDMKHILLLVFPLCVSCVGLEEVMKGTIDIIMSTKFEGIIDRKMVINDAINIGAISGVNSLPNKIPKAFYILSQLFKNEQESEAKSPQDENSFNDLKTNVSEKTRQWMYTINDESGRNIDQMNLLAESILTVNKQINDRFNEMNSIVTEFKESIDSRLSGIDGVIERGAALLEGNIKRQFRELKELNVQMQFTEAVMFNIDALQTLMIKIMKLDPSDPIYDMTTRDFIKLYKVKRPRRILMDLSNRFQHKYTNPLIAAMELHIFKSKLIFDYWKDAIGYIVYRSLVVEGFYFGIVEFSKNTTTTEYLYPCIESAEGFLKQFHTFHESHLNVDPEVFWPQLVGNNVFQIIENEKDSNKVADEILNLLDGIYTTDVFYIYVAEGNYKTNNNSYDFKICEDIPHKFYAVSPQNIVRSSIDRGRNKQITSYNLDGTLTATIYRSEKHSKKTNIDNSILNANFKSNKQRFSFSENINPEKIHDFFEILYKDSDGDIGGAVISTEPMTERITNGQHSPLDWYNQVSDKNTYVNIIWT